MNKATILIAEDEAILAMTLLSWKRLCSSTGWTGKLEGESQMYSQGPPDTMGRFMRLALFFFVGMFFC